MAVAGVEGGFAGDQFVDLHRVAPLGRRVQSSVVFYLGRRRPDLGERSPSHQQKERGKKTLKSDARHACILALSGR